MHSESPFDRDANIRTTPLNDLRRELVMSISMLQLEQQLMDSDAGQAVYDALVQANVDLRMVSLDLVKDMLTAELRHRRLRRMSAGRPRLSIVG